MIDRLDKQSKQYLLSLPQVTGIGHGFKEVGGVQTAQEAIMILVTKKIPKDSLNQRALVPKTINGMPTDVIEVGTLVAHEACKSNQGDRNPEEKDSTSLGNKEEDTSVRAEELNLFDLNIPSRTSRIRPAMPGISISHYLVTGGTFGAVVYDQVNGQALILSNNHILANSTTGTDLRAKINDPILQPGTLDGGRQNRNVIASLERFIPLVDPPRVNVVDCAAAKPLKPDYIDPEILGIGKVRGVGVPTLGLAVKKSGRTTGLTNGQIRAINVTADVTYGSRVRRFEKQILTTPMSSSGDSGSLVLDNYNRAIGLLFAGSNTSTIINPIQEVLSLLKVRF